MLKLSVLGISLGFAALLSAASPGDLSQTMGEKEEFDATAIVNNNLGSGAGRVIMRVERWSTEAERGLLTRTLLQKGAGELLDVLQDRQLRERLVDRASEFVVRHSWESRRADYLELVDRLCEAKEKGVQK